MELDNIKDLWQKENPTKTPEITLDKQKEIRMPLEKIRLEMLSYYNKTLLGICLLIASFFILFEKPSNDIIIKAILFILIYLAVIFYYFRKFFSVYKKLTSQNPLTKVFLEDLRFELRISLNELKSFQLFSLSMIFAEFLIIVPTNDFSDQNKMLKLLCFIVIMLPFGIYIQRRKIKKAFELPIRELELILKDLKN